jgi:hypothetical protein
MQPEEIIQQKEWHQLTEAERQAIQPLAPDEQEYNLLKKMLLVADEAVIGVPPVSPAIQERLHHSLKGVDKKSGSRKWYYAAAAILIIAVSTWFVLLNRKNIPPGIVTAPSIKKEVSEDSFAISKTSIPKKEITYPEIKDVDGPKNIVSPNHTETKEKKSFTLKKETPDPGDTNNENINQQVSYASISTLIKDDTELMALVTEVY